MKTNFFETAQLCFSVTSEIELDFGAAGKFFLSDKTQADIHYEIIPGKPAFNGETVYSGDIFSVCETENKIIRRFRNRHGDFALCREKDNLLSAVLVGDADVMREQEKSLIPGYFALEVPFIYNNVFILHSSLVKLNDSAIAFSGASGVGKSTQAKLWSDIMHADIISGDRSCISTGGTEISAYGTFYSGSSDIYRNEGAPLKAIVFLSHAKENTLKRLSAAQAFAMIYSQALNNPWDGEYVKRLVAAVEKTATEIPVYSLSCRPDEDAVNLLYNELFR